MGALRFVLGDQLTRDLSSLRDLDPARDTVLMVEVHDETTYVPHHKQKIVFLLSAMRHFAQALREEGVAVDYVELEAPGNTGSFTGELQRAVERHRPERVVVTEPGEWRVWQAMRGWKRELGSPVEIRADDRYFCSRRAFARWADGREATVMESFYRHMRAVTGLLMDGDRPVGGRWNFDQDNRKRLPGALATPPRERFEPDEITRAVMSLVARRFGNHFGDIEPFGWAVTREGALEALAHFVDAVLPRFGDYQDAMRGGAPFLFHSVLSPYLNSGLLTPREVCARAERAYREGAAPLNAVKGFVRQIIGWREYVRGAYWLRMPHYSETNALDAHRPLPDFYWTGDTDLNCLRNAVGDTRANAYAHHILRLMVLGNFALIAGVEPRLVEEWYLVVFADAYEWVELPNVHGIVLWADGGVTGSKPYAASGAYINRMSDYCRSCRYDVAQKSGPNACPFNYLYWNFMIENEAKLAENGRMAHPYRTLRAMGEVRKSEIRADSAKFLRKIGLEGREQRTATDYF